MSKKEFNIVNIDINEYKNIIQDENIKNIPIYMDPDSITYYNKIEILKINKGAKLIALFAYPLFYKGEEIWVKRDYRFLPYSSPFFIGEIDTLHRKKVCFEIFNYIFQKYDVVYLPLSPNFKDVSAIQYFGGFTEIRHTNIIKSKLSYTELNSKLRNHIIHAEKCVEVKIDDDFNKFRFDIAIKGNKEEQEKRKNMAINLIKNGRGIIISAIENGISVAGAIVIFDDECAYLLHSWQNADTPRGCIPLIIFKAINWCFENLNIKIFDFEGSVIKSIDDFFATFNTEVVTYPYIHFSKTEENFKRIISTSMNIAGRRKEDATFNNHKK